MRIRPRLLALPLLVAAAAAPALGDVRDRAGLFSPEAVKKADGELQRITRETGVPVTIATVRGLDGMSIDKAQIEYGRSERIKGLLVLIAAREHKIEAGASKDYDRYFSRPLYDRIYESFMPGFKKNDFDGGLSAGVSTIDSTLRELKSEHGGQLAPSAPAAGARRPAANAPAPAPGPRVPAHGRSGMGMLISLVLLILGVMILFRLLGALFGAGRGHGPGGYGQGGIRGPGYGPGYGGPGYGGAPGGGGFMSSLFGGIGGAMAGNWLYDQFSGRHHQYDQTGYVPPADAGSVPTDAGNDWGANAGDGGGDWGGGGDVGGGGGDWGGGGGGGGDWGGGGGDWGGGGGGDWGGGGGDGGSW